MNLRKITAVITALALLLLPSLSLGESAAKTFEQKALEAGRSLTTTVTFEPGDLFTQDPSLSLVGDVLKSLTIRTTGQKGEENSLGAFSILLQDKPALSFTAFSKGDEFHLMSNLLGDSILSFTPQEFVQLSVTVADAALAAAEGYGIGEKERNALKAQIENYRSVITGIFTAKTSGTDLTAFTLPFQLPEFNQESLQTDLVTPVITWATGIISAVETTTGTFESEKHDTATTRMVYSISAEKIQELLQIVSDWATKEGNMNAIADFLASTSMGASQLNMDEAKATLQKELKELPATFAKSVAPRMKQPVTFTMLTDDKGNVPAMEIKGQFTGKNAAAGDFTFLTGIYSKTEGTDIASLYTLDAGAGQNIFRLTFSSKAPADGSKAAASAWKLEAAATEKDTEIFALALDFTGEEKATDTQADEAWKLNIDLNAGGIPINAALDYKSASAFDGKDVKTDAAVTATLTGLESPVLTIRTVTESAEPVAYPQIPADSVRMGKMTIEELTAWGETAFGTALTSLMSAMQYLPESVSNLIFGTATFN